MDGKEEEKEKYIVGEVPTQYGNAIIDMDNKKAYTIETAIAKMMNDIEKLKKLLN